jgi:hypothetical protein
MAQTTELERRLRQVQDEYGSSIEALTHAARIGAELEREACARICEGTVTNALGMVFKEVSMHAIAIRARGGK